MGKNLVYRARPGAATVEPWITDGLHKVLGVFADERSDTLWVCSDDFSPGRADTSLKAFSLKSGALKATHPFPGGGVCNDVALKDGAVYVADTVPGRILRLAPGAKTLEVWFDDPIVAGVDGLAFAPDGVLYANSFTTHRFLRIDVEPDGSAGAGHVLATSLPIKSPDAIRLTGDGRMLMVEGGGRLDEVTVKGDRAVITVLKDGLKRPVSVTVVGQTAWVLEGEAYPPDPAGKGAGGPVFHATPVPLRQ
jgi:hypothetical protein